MANPETIGRYRVLARLGSGGMGSVYLAEDPLLERRVAIKLLREDSDDVRARFAREARTIARLRHENIVTVFDVGESADGRPFISMEYVQGETLSGLILARNGGALGFRLRLIEQLCAGLNFAHDAGIIHRDIKPANLIVDRNGILKILDFGVARLVDSNTTSTGALLGTLNYMSPEQLTGQPIDGRSDLFAAGAVLYELLTFQKAFPGSLDEGVLSRIIQAPAPTLGIGFAGSTPALESILATALQKSPRDRFANASAMGLAISNVRLQIEAAIETVRFRAADSQPVVTLSASDLPSGRLASRGTSALHRHDEQEPDFAYPAVAVGGHWLPRLALRVLGVLVPVVLVAGALYLSVGLGWRMSTPPSTIDDATKSGSTPSRSDGSFGPNRPTGSSPPLRAGRRARSTQELQKRPVVGTGDAQRPPSPDPKSAPTLNSISGPILIEPLVPAPGAAVSFTAPVASESNRDPLTFSWKFGDGVSLSGAGIRVTHTYNSPGEYWVTLTVTDSRGGTATTMANVIVRIP